MLTICQGILDWHRYCLIVGMNKQDKEEIKYLMRRELARFADNQKVACDSCNGSGRQLDITTTSGERECGKCDGYGKIKRKELWGYQKL